MKPFKDDDQSRRFLRWFRYGSIIGFVLALLRLLLRNGGETDPFIASDSLVVNAFSFASIILFAGVAGGLMAMISNWIKR